MELKDRIKAFDNLGKNLREWLKLKNEKKVSPLDSVIVQAFNHNGWFDETQVIQSLTEVSNWLTVEKLNDWAEKYDFNNPSVKKVGVIMAGNIPLVGFHDYLSVLISGHKLLAKLSSKDEVLLKFVHSELIKIEPGFDEVVEFSTESFKDVDAVIATGSDNSARYFEYYFSKKPHIIRKNRTSIAVLTGKESVRDLNQLGNDIFNYYGLGCRNITKLYLPKGFSIDWLYSGLLDHGQVINNHKYQNNYDYHKSLFLLNGDKLWDNNFLLLKNDKALSSPVGTLFYEEYESIEELESQIMELSEQIQCRVGVNGFPFGHAQKPELTDYADNIDVLSFLTSL
ncbi:MAG: acyl-CoA reductase [Salibacteraceae bacterium]